MTVTGLPKGMRWVPVSGYVWQVFNRKRVSVGAWANEAMARKALAKLKPGAQLVTCKDFGGWPSQFMHHMKREAIAVEMKVRR